MARRILCSGVLFFLCVMLFWKPLKLLMYFSFQHVYLSHIFFIPFLSLFLLWWERERIFSSVGSSYHSGLLLLLVAAVLYGQDHLRRVQQHETDLKSGLGQAPLPDALARKYLNANREWGWQ